MEEHEPFISAIELHPDDTTTRLVYADWLDERDHPAGAYLRTELALAALPSGSAQAGALQWRLRALHQGIDPAWLARFDQPRVMRANPTPFPAAWWTAGLPGVLDIDSTYQRFDYDTLPPLRYPRFTGAFDWLPGGQAGSDPDDRYTPHLALLVTHLTGLGLTAPRDFVRWLSDSRVWRVPSCTGCSADRPWDAAAVAGPPGARVVPFYIDSQGCITWYLYLTPDGYSAVVASGAFLCNGWEYTAGHDPSAPLDNPNPPDENPGFVFVAPSVEAFLYRWRVENTLWRKLADPRFDFHDPTPMTAEEQAYADFYRQHPPAAT